MQRLISDDRRLQNALQYHVFARKRRQADARVALTRIDFYRADLVVERGVCVQVVLPGPQDDPLAVEVGAIKCRDPCPGGHTNETCASLDAA